MNSKNQKQIPEFQFVIKLSASKINKARNETDEKKKYIDSGNLWVQAGFNDQGKLVIHHNVWCDLA